MPSVCATRITVGVGAIPTNGFYGRAARTVLKKLALFGSRRDCDLPCVKVIGETKVAKEPGVEANIGVALNRIMLAEINLNYQV